MNVRLQLHIPHTVITWSFLLVNIYRKCKGLWLVNSTYIIRRSADSLRELSGCKFLSQVT